ncbi:MFS transporter [Frigoribacterium sp. 2-23]|uniref:MFS transporter n=1 Tax=Frigoribacterium sp. 2-23 TaxID=3415006 RepID=UPI003C6F195A
MNWSLLQIPAFRALWLGRLLSWVGNGVAPIAIAFAAIDLGAGATELGLVVAARSLPNVVLVLFGGAVADRVSKRLVCIVSAAASALSLGVAATLLLTGHETLWTLAAIGAVNGAAAAFFAPASNALLRDVVAERWVRDGTVLNRVGMNVGLVIGAAVGGGLVGTIDTGVGLAGGAVLFALAGVAFVGLPAAPVHALGEASLWRTVARDLGGGLAFVARTRWLSSTMALTFTVQFVFAAGVQILGPIAADGSFGRTLWGFAGAIQTFGLIVGAVWAGSLRGRLRLSVACLGATALAVPLLVLAAVFSVDPYVVDPLHWFFFLAIGLFVASVGLELFTVPLDVTVQLQVPPAYLGRVFACLTLASLAGMPLGEIAVGPVSDTIGAPATLSAAAALVIAVAASVALSSQVRRVDAVLR